MSVPCSCGWREMWLWGVRGMSEVVTVGDRYMKDSSRGGDLFVPRKGRTGVQARWSSIRKGSRWH